LDIKYKLIAFNSTFIIIKYKNRAYQSSGAPMAGGTLRAKELWLQFAGTPVSVTYRHWNPTPCEQSGPLVIQFSSLKIAIAKIIDAGNHDCSMTVHGTPEIHLGATDVLDLVRLASRR